MLADFSNNSSVHGVKYLGERRRHWIERGFWIVAFLISVIGCTVMIFKLFIKWQLSPVIVSFAEKSTPVWEIPFPAVTICPETKAIKKYVDFTNGYLHAHQHQQTEANMTQDELRSLEALAHICDPQLFLNADPLDSGLQSDEIVSLLKSITNPQNETTLFCKWRNMFLPCENFFTEIITEEGFCYTFNALKFTETFKDDA